MTNTNPELTQLDADIAEGRGGEETPFTPRQLADLAGVKKSQLLEDIATGRTPLGKKNLGVE